MSAGGGVVVKLLFWILLWCTLVGIYTPVLSLIVILALGRAFHYFLVSPRYGTHSRGTKHCGW